MDNLGNHHWPNTDLPASSAALDMQAGGVGCACCLQVYPSKPGCTSVTASETNLECHHQYHSNATTAPSTNVELLNNFRLPYWVTDRKTIDSYIHVTHRHLQPLGIDEVHIRPILNKLAQTDEELVIDSSSCEIQTFIKFRCIILEDRLIQDRKAFIQNILLTYSGAIIGILFHEADTYKKFTLRLTDPVSTSSYASPLAWLATLVPGVQDTCHCMLCILRLISSTYKRWDRVSVLCPYPLCSQVLLRYDTHWQGHLKCHMFHCNMYHCDHHGCTRKCKRWDDLKRHILAHHCLEGKKFPCIFPGCERGGENGFPRRDKMNEHYKNVHKGVAIPPKNSRRLAPKK